MIKMIMKYLLVFTMRAHQWVRHAQPISTFNLENSIITYSSFARVTWLTEVMLLHEILPGFTFCPLFVIINPLLSLSMGQRRSGHKMAVLTMTNVDHITHTVHELITFRETKHKGFDMSSEIMMVQIVEGRGGQLNQVLLFTFVFNLD